MNGLPFVYTPRPGESVSISRDPDGRCAIAVSSGSRASSARILAEEAPRFAGLAVQAIFEAAGKTGPVILDQPEIDPGAAKGVNVFVIDLDRDLSVRVGIGKQKAIPLAPSVARHLASVIAAYADAAEAARDAPGPAEVEELTRILRGITPGMACPGEEDYKTAVVRPFAEAALKWMRGREAKP